MFVVLLVGAVCQCGLIIRGLLPAQYSQNRLELLHSSSLGRVTAPGLRL